MLTNNKAITNSFLGFEDMFDKIDEMLRGKALGVPGWPPYNIVKKSDTEYVLEFAVAGFAKSDITINLEGNKLVIEGSTSTDDEEDESNYLYKGIANRAFKRFFTISDKLEVKDAEVLNGILKVNLESLSALNSVRSIEVK